MGILAITRKVANTKITAAAMNTNFDEIEAVVNALSADNIAADAVGASELNSDVVRTNYGLVQHTDGSLYVDVSDTNPGLEISDGGLRAKVYGMLSRGTNGVVWGRAGDCVLSSSSTTPDGFTDVTATYSNKFIRINATALSTGGAATLAGTTGSHVLTTAEMPAHTHTIAVRSADDHGNTYPAGVGSEVGSANVNTGSSGDGGGHTHTLTDTALVPEYVTLKMYKMD